MANIPLTEQQMGRMNPEQIRLYNQQAGIRSPAPAPTPMPKPTVVPPPPQVIPKPTVYPGTTTPLNATPVAGSQPLIPPAAQPLDTPTPQPPVPPTVAAAAAPSMGGNAPVQTVPTTTPIPAFTLPSLDGSSYVATATGNPAAQPESPYDVVTGNLNKLLGQDSPYIQNARLRGAEAAQARGLRNSSIAAGASERAAIEAAQPIVSEIQDLTQQRENLAFQGEQATLDRIQQVNNAMLDYQFKNALQGNAALQQDWLSSQEYTRQFNGDLAKVPIANAAALSQMIAQYALENPEVYTPATISGMQNFFTGSLAAILQQYFPSVYGSAPSGG